VTAAWLAAAALATSCGSAPTEPVVDYFSVRLVSVESSDGAGGWLQHELDSLRDDPLPFATATRLTVEIEPVSPSGEVFDGYVQIDLVPGDVVAVSSDTAEVSRTAVRITAGQPVVAEVEVDGAFGDARLVVEDAGHRPGAIENARCDDGIDNDGDGRTDYPLDPGCFLRNDDSEEEGTYAVGSSDAIPFANPRLSHVQGCDLMPALSNQAISVDVGFIYVTAVVSEGFYATDLSFVQGGCDTTTTCCDGGRYAHIYAYNYNTPYGMRVCDRLTKVGGIVSDFYGFTELNFPNWELFDLDPTTPEIDLMRAEPHDITPDLCPLEDLDFAIAPEMIPDRRLMETFEAALVHVVDAELPTDWVNCDYNDNGYVSYSAATEEFTPEDEVRVPAGYCTPRNGMCSETQCNDVCNESSCAELSNYYEYGQFPVFVEGVPILVVTSAGAPEFNPREWAGQRISRIGGVLKEFAPLPTPWTIQPRCRQDIYIEGDDQYVDVPIHQRCVPSEETGDYEDPY
jgi:hypothetical protein